MARAAAMLIGLTAISAGIREMKGIIANAYERGQLIGQSIINHDLNGGKEGERTGDCSKAKDLVNALRTQEDKRNMIAWLGYFGNIACKMENGICTEVRHFPADSKRYRNADLEGAQANKWFEPYTNTGEKAHWFEGPAKQLYTPGTIGAIGDNIINLTDRFLGTDKRTGQLYDKVDRGDGTMVARYNLSETELRQAEETLKGLRNLGYILGAREETEEVVATIDQLTNRVQELNNFMSKGEEVVTDLNNLNADAVVAA
jgi:hypothetical protein